MKVPVYKNSHAEALELEEEGKWLESHKANIECKEGIERSIRENYDGMRLGGDVIKSQIGRASCRERVYWPV